MHLNICGTCFWLTVKSFVGDTCWDVWKFVSVFAVLKTLKLFVSSNNYVRFKPFILEFFTKNWTCAKIRKKTFWKKCMSDWTHTDSNTVGHCPHFQCVITENINDWCIFQYSLAMKIILCAINWHRKKQFMVKSLVSCFVVGAFHKKVPDSHREHFFFFFLKPHNEKSTFWIELEKNICLLIL